MALISASSHLIGSWRLEASATVIPGHWILHAMRRPRPVNNNSRPVYPPRYPRYAGRITTHDAAFKPGGTSLEVIAAAKDYIAKGIAIVAVRPNKKPFGNLDDGKNWRRRFTLEEILDRLDRNCRAIGFLGGALNNHIVPLDFDTEAGETWWCEQCKAAGIDPHDFPSAVTPGKVRSNGSRRSGKHRYVRDDRKCLGNSQGKLKELGIDVRGKGHAMLPPSSHPDGGTYRWVEGRSLDDFPDGPPSCPDFVYDAIAGGRQSNTRGNGQDTGASGASPDDRVRDFCQNLLHSTAERLAREQPNNRNIELNNAAIKLGHYAHYGVYDEDEAKSSLHAACEANGYLSEHAESSFNSSFQSGWGDGIKDPWAIPTAAPPVVEAPWPLPLGEAAFHGPAGEFVRLVEPHSEADPAALLNQFLDGFGNLIGRGPHVRVEDTEHGANLFVAIVGNTSKARKGTSLDRVRQQLSMVRESNIEDIQMRLKPGSFPSGYGDWSTTRVLSGLSTGEGLIAAVRDASKKRERDEQGTVSEVEGDDGVYDKRAFVVQTELAQLLKAMERTGNTVSAILRDAWDGRTLAIMTKNNPARATGAHISIVGHITINELRRTMTEIEYANGFANRFLFVCAQRSKSLPFGGKPDPGRMATLARQLEEAAGRARIYGKSEWDAAMGGPRMDREIKMDARCRELWVAEYERLSAAQPGVLGAVTARAEAQVLRLALIYCLLDGLPEIRDVHLRAAMEVWRYAMESARHIWGDALGDPTADIILQALRQAGAAGMGRTEISAHFGRNTTAAELDRALGELVRHGRAHMQSKTTKGRPEQRWYASGGEAPKVNS
jgi:hypothetical protein